MSSPNGPTVLTPRRFRIMLGLFPPFLASRTRVVRLADDYRSCRVRVRSSWLTRNLQGSMFGGTIFAAADPFFALLYWQVLARRGLRIQAWVKTARVDYRRPVVSALTFDFELTEDDVRSGVAALERSGRFSRVHTTAAIDREGEVCASIELEVVLRLAGDRQPEVAAF